VYINVTIQLQGDEEIGKNAETLAAEILPICNGDPEHDTINVNISQTASKSPATVPVPPTA
jgi:hypothetical protein